MTTLHERFIRVARANPGAPALIDGDGVLTYGQVHAEADALSSVIRGHATDTDRLIAVRLGRHRHTGVAIMAVLMAGRGYVPIDADYPSSRRDYLHTDCGARIVITDGPLDEAESAVATVGRFTIAERAGTAKEVPGDVAYVIYTSGSTGDPKGCVVQHRQVLALLESCAEVVKAGPGDVWSLFHSTSFDVSVWELFGALLSGGTAVAVPTPVAQDPHAFATLLADRGVTVLSQIPSMFGFLVAETLDGGPPLPSLRYVILAGEAIAPEVLLRWWERGSATGAEVINMYGPTETTVYSTAISLTPADCRNADRGRTPIGRPLAHEDITLRDEDGRIVPTGEPGEIWVSGSGVAHGYLERPELTAERFTTRDGKRHYRTGDWAVADTEGALHYIGRRDTQVKIRGFRVELGEIEAVIARLSGVRDAACGVGTNRAGHSVLTAYIVTETGTAPTKAMVRSHVRELLPTHMHPHRFERVERLPTSLNGKLDRPRLPDLPTLDWGVTS